MGGETRTSDRAAAAAKREGTSAGVGENALGEDGRAGTRRGGGAGGASAKVDGSIEDHATRGALSRGE